MKRKCGLSFLGIQNSEYRKQCESVWVFVFVFAVTINCFMMLVTAQLIPAYQELAPFWVFLFRPL